MEDSKSLIQKDKLYNHKSLCLVEFSHATLNKRAKIKFDLYKGDIKYQKQKRILVASTDHLLYSGTNYDQEMFKVTSSVLKLAVLNKKTNRMKLYDVDYFLLKPILKCILEEDTVEKSRGEQSQDLALEFGSKTKRRNINSRLKFQSIGNDSIQDSVLAKLSQNVLSVPESSENPPSDAIIPPQNQNATNVAEVYNIFDIISQEEYKALNSAANIFKDIPHSVVSTWKKESKYSELIIRFLEIHSQNLSHDNAKLLCYLHFMFCFLKVGFKDWKKKDPIPEVPEPFKKKMSSRYLINKSLPQRMKDKLLADAIVLCLHLNNFFIDGKLISSSTKISSKRLVTIAYALGCHVRSSKKDDSQSIELKLPLYKYEPLGRRKRN